MLLVLLVPMSLAADVPTSVGGQPVSAHQVDRTVPAEGSLTARVAARALPEALVDAGLRDALELRERGRLLSAVQALLAIAEVDEDLDRVGAALVLAARIEAGVGDVDTAAATYAAVPRDSGLHQLAAAERGVVLFDAGQLAESRSVLRRQRRNDDLAAEAWEALTAP